MSSSATTGWVQLGLDELATPLHDATFVVVDLETTGGSPNTCGITEIGAVKTRGGEVLGEFTTLVNPGQPIPAFITALTGITTAMVASAPTIDEVLPSFLEFLSDAVLVAHNAPFDVGFLKAACRESGQPWPDNQIVDTVRLARLVITKDEAPNCKLSTLAALFRARNSPTHRALDDARATVDVFHGIVERLGALGVTDLGDLAETNSVPRYVQRKKHLADGLPNGPGVYQFIGPADEVLYVGTSVAVRTRVRSYFTRAEKRSRMAEMIGIAERVVAIECGTRIEAQVRELRLIAEHRPRYNRRSRFPERMPWVRLTTEPFPRLSIVRSIRPEKDGSVVAHIGPFNSVVAARDAVDAIVAATGIRTCTSRLPAQPKASAGCLLAEVQRCPAPCRPDGDPQRYAEVVETVRELLTGSPRKVIEQMAKQIAKLTATERFEEAAVCRNQVSSYVRGLARAQEFRAFGQISELIAGRPTHDNGWELIRCSHGRLTGSATVPLGADPEPVIAVLSGTGEYVAPPLAPATAAHPEETMLLLDWLTAPGTRLISASQGWALPVAGAGSVQEDGLAAVVAEIRSATA
jgi:DNA polymerase-3 subunit epsilon